ncbi:MAG TPA: flagellar motor switch protein FliN [Deltaproteobacteria bacterium]|nr:MAG: flagellar motor switch protein FliN [Deltaproteobacteria bacterium GWA2_55_82]OIJ72837.1 MAG: flagellar motor switch protein FliN [Deltaproteobacteria bacterium GWC2_55_46]HBG46116.1 flagellar motor switch protein FliN [Deltaproteobacteria bacterium]HCY11614.1 flagellar motor switch protein FliN [Deltaproteobacteria bacterium]
MSENEQGTTNGAMDDQWSTAFEEAKQAQPAPQPKKNEVEARPASFGNLKHENNGSITNMEMLLDIPLTVAVEIGRTRMLVKDLLQLGQGAVVELEKLAGEPMEILVNGRLIARGEAVVVNDKFGVKLTDIVSQSERLNRLK